MSEIFLPVTYQLGVGGIGGFLVGYTIKKMVKIAAIIVAIFVAFIMYLGYTGVISVNYGKLTDIISKALPIIEQAPRLLTPIISSLPFAGTFAVGFTLGLKKG